VRSFVTIVPELFPLKLSRVDGGVGVIMGTGFKISKISVGLPGVVVRQKIHLKSEDLKSAHLPPPRIVLPGFARSYSADTLGKREVW
jgi:hypothetical protein